MKISIFTPTNNNKFLQEIYKSLKEQSHVDWEWNILYNNGGVPINFNDTRVKTHICFKAPEWVGPLKDMAAQKGTGDILLELDHDDLLVPTALEEVNKVFVEDPEVGFVYSNTLHAMGDLTKNMRFDEKYGWKYREVNYKGHVLDEHISFPPTPDSISRIWFAPNHLRAFRKNVFYLVGGYNREMRILDDLDLMCRMYLTTKFKHIDKGLYVYRVHGENTWLKYNKEIQDNIYRIYDKYIEQLVLRWCDLNNLKKIDLGGRFRQQPQYESVDLKDADHICDLNERWPFDDSSIGVIRAVDVLEHLKDPLHVMKESYRVLAPGGWINICVPSTEGRGAFQDPTHKSYWNENSFLYWYHKDWAEFIDTPVRFQCTRNYTTELNKIKVAFTYCHLISLKDGYRPAGLIEI